MTDTERSKNILLYVFPKWKPGDSLDDVAGQVGPVI